MKALAVIILVCLSFLGKANELVDIYGRIPFVKDVQISPDGSHIAYLRDMKGKYVLVMQNITTAGGKPNVFGMEKAEIRSFTWVSKSGILLDMTEPYYSSADTETFTLTRTGIINIHTNNVTWPFKSSRFKYNIAGPQLVNKLINDDEHVLMSHYYWGVGSSESINSLYKVKLSDGSREQVFKKYLADSWITDSQGDVFLYRKFDVGEDATLNLYRAKNSDEFTPLKYYKNKKLAFFKKRVTDLSEDKKTVYFYHQNENKISTLVKAKIENNIVGESVVIVEDGKYDINYTIENYHSLQLSGVSVIKDYPEYEYFDPELAQVQADLVTTFPNAEVHITSYTVKRDKFLVSISGAKYTQEYVLYDKKQGQLQTLATSYPQLNKELLASVSTFTYVTEDGTSIDSYITKPVNYTGKDKLPLIVLPHGGPESRDDMSFDWIRQFYASQGYVVFQPNYRGSSGYGEKFAELGHGQWGKKMQSDVDDGVSQLIISEQIDSDRICIVGGSYGGYVALYSATTNVTRYKCSVSFAGISDLSDIFYHASEQKMGLDYWRKSIGKRREKDELRKYSPFHLISKKTIPTLFLHGDKDTIVPKFQSKKMYRRLKKLIGSKTKYVEIEGADHWFSTGKSRKIFLKESISFIRKYTTP